MPVVASLRNVIGAGGRRRPINYSVLSNIELLVDFTGLSVGMTNAYGTVDGSGNITALKSLAPGPTGRDFTPTGTAPTLAGGSGVFGGAGVLRHATAATWNFMHFNATPANMKYTIHAVAKLGTTSNPNAAYGILGNNAASGGNKGISLFYDDRVSVPRNNAFRYMLTTGTNAVFNSVQDDVISPNSLLVLTIEVDLSLATSYKLKTYINGVLTSVADVYVNTSMVTTPTFNLDIGSVGNSSLLLSGSIRELIIQSTVETGAIRHSFVQALLAKHGIAATPFDSPVDVTQTLEIFSTYQESVGRYYLSALLDQHPTKKYLVLGSFVDGADHTADPAKKVSIRRSTNYGLSWGARADVYDPPGNLFVQDMAGGFTPNGRHHIFADVHTYNGTSVSEAPHLLTYLYSDDDGVTYSQVDLTSLLPSDGLATFRVIGNVIQSGDYLLVPFYKQTNEGVTTESANYLFRILVNSDPTNLANWSVTTIRAKASNYVNEAAIVALNGTHVLAMIRDEATFEYEQHISSDNGVNWSKQGEQSFGETFSSAAPCRLVLFQIAGTPVIACYYPDRANNLYKVIYGTVANIIAGGTSGFVVGSKATLANTNRMIHYGSVYHPNGNFNAILYSAYEKTPLDLSNNDLITAVLPSTHYATVRTALGL